MLDMIACRTVEMMGLDNFTRIVCTINAVKRISSSIWEK